MSASRAEGRPQLLEACQDVTSRYSGVSTEGTHLFDVLRDSLVTLLKVTSDIARERATQAEQAREVLERRVRELERREADPSRRTKRRCRGNHSVRGGSSGSGREAGVMMEPESRGDHSSGHHLVNGHLIALLPNELVVTDAMDRESTRVRLKEISGVHRGGADVIVVRGYHDPVTLCFTNATVAERFERSLSAMQWPRLPLQSLRRWWQFWKR